MKTNVKRVALLGVLTTLALMLSYIEALIPPISAVVPGIKIGLPNVIVIYILYEFDFKSAIAVSVLRVFISSLFFGSILTLFFSISGAISSLLIMAFLKRLNKFSKIAVSILGAVMHNLAQIFVAVIIMNTAEIFYLMPLLCLSGVISGVLIGAISAIFSKMLKRVKI